MRDPCDRRTCVFRFFDLIAATLVSLTITPVGAVIAFLIECRLELRDATSPKLLACIGFRNPTEWRVAPLTVPLIQSSNKRFG